MDAPDEEREAEVVPTDGALHPDMVRLGERAADLEYQKEQLEGNNAALASVNAQLDVHIARAQEMKSNLVAEADRIEAENENRRRENARLRERLRVLQESLDRK